MPRIGRYWLALHIYHLPSDPNDTGQRYMVKVGIDNSAQGQAADLILVKILPVGKKVKRGQRFGILETAKWMGALIAPVSGKITQVNEEVLRKPELANKDPHGKGWMVVINANNPEDDLIKFVEGTQDIEWLKKDSKEVAKEIITYYEEKLKVC